MFKKYCIMKFNIVSDLMGDRRKETYVDVECSNAFVSRLAEDFLRVLLENVLSLT